MSKQKIEVGGDYQCRNGGDLGVRVLCTDAYGCQPVVALVRFSDGEYVRRFNADGVYDESGKEGPADLILRRVEPKKESQFINLYPQAHPAYGAPRSTRESADKDKVAGRVGVVRIDYENGHPVSVALESAEQPQ